MLSLPAWASWDWGEKYLPANIHADWQEFKKELNMLDKCKFADRNAGANIILGFGLLLRECWRAVEVEIDDESSPQFLCNSNLGKTKVIDLVIKAIKEAIGRLSLPDANEEGPKEKELSCSAEGRKAKANQKKPGKFPASVRRSHTPPPPAASSSKTSSSTRKEDAGLVRNIRSQRLRKPSKKLRDSD